MKIEFTTKLLEYLLESKPRSVYAHLDCAQTHLKQARDLVVMHVFEVAHEKHTSLLAL